MKKSELRQMIKEEYQKILKEATPDPFDDIYVVKKDTKVGRQNLKAGTVIYATGGGQFENFKAGIKGLSDLRANKDIERIPNTVFRKALDLEQYVANIRMNIVKLIEQYPFTAKDILKDFESGINKASNILTSIG